MGERCRVGTLHNTATAGKRGTCRSVRVSIRGHSQQHKLE
jgi:hypothetical protein